VARWSRVTVNAGLRWEPYFGQHVVNNAVTIFVMDNFLKASKHGVPQRAGRLDLSGRSRIPEGQYRVEHAVVEPLAARGRRVGRPRRRAPRGAVVVLDGLRLHARRVPQHQRGRAAVRQPLDHHRPAGGLDDPYGGNDPHPIVTGPDTQYIAFGAFGSMDPDINSPRVQQWNATVEQQLGSNWGVSVSYLGSYSDRLWAQTALNPGIYMGTGAVHHPGRVVLDLHDQCEPESAARAVSINPSEAAKIGASISTRRRLPEVQGVETAAQRRSADLMINGSYTLSRCFGTTTTTGLQSDEQRLYRPEHPEFEPVPAIRTHAPGLDDDGVRDTAGRQRRLGALASRWRVTRILSARSGNRLNVTSGVDQAFTGINLQRPDKVSDDFYASPRR
jgi:hypothetical protein